MDSNWKILFRIVFKCKVKIPEDCFLFFAQPNFFHTAFVGKKIFRIHDLFPITNPEWFTFLARNQFRFAFNRLTENDILLCNSQETLDVFRRFFPKLANVAFIVDCSIDSTRMVACKNCQSCSLAYVPRSFALMVGTVEPRKNYITAIKAWKLKSDKIPYENLIIVGKPGWKSRKTLRQLRKGRNQDIIYLENVCDAGLQRLYQSASLFLSTSLNEGFNIPLAEAARQRLPVAISDIPVHRSHAPQTAFFFDPLNINQISKIFTSNYEVLKPLVSLPANFRSNSEQQLKEVFTIITNLQNRSNKTI
jgi:glycosyltransferase involved in cell wall biosynthesis